MTVSSSPLCPHIEQGSGEGWLRGLAVRPRAVKVFNTTAAREVKAVDADILVVGRRFVPDQGRYMAEGVAGGQRFVDEIQDLHGYDILEGLNECLPFEDEGAIRAADAFHVGFVAACQARGIKPCILNIAVGNPREDLVRWLAPSVQAAGEAGGYVGYHGYGPVRILSDEEFYAMRAPLKLTPLLRQAGVQAPMRWLYTEAGFDDIPGQPLPNGPWKDLLRKNQITLAGIEEQHEAFAARLVELGVPLAFMFTFYASREWRAYDYAASPDLLASFARHWEAHTAPLAPPAPEVPAVVYARPSGGESAIAMRGTPGLADGEDLLGTVPAGTALAVDGEAGDFYKVVAYVAKSVVATTPPGE